MEEQCLVLKICLGKVGKVQEISKEKNQNHVTDAFEHQSALSQLYPIIYGLLVGLIFLLCFSVHLLLFPRENMKTLWGSKDFLILLSENSLMVVKTRQKSIEDYYLQGFSCFLPE